MRSQDLWDNVHKLAAIIWRPRGWFGVSAGLMTVAVLVVSPSIGPYAFQMALYVLGELGILPHSVAIPSLDTPVWQVVVAVLLVLLAFVAPIIGPRLAGKTAERPSSVLAIRHESLEGNAHAINAMDLPESLRGAEITHKRVDQSMFYASGRVNSPDAALAVQASLGTTTKEFVTQHPGSPVIYYGKAHIPFVFTAGYALQSDVRIVPYELNRTDGSWRSLGDGPGNDLGLTVEREGDLTGQGDVAVKVSISYEVDSADIRQVVSPDVPIIHIRIRQPVIDCIQTRDQVEQIAAVFRQTLDEVRWAKTVHVFASAPMSVVFALGQRVSPTIHPIVRIHNHFAKDTVKYGWAIQLNSGAAPEAIQIGAISNTGGAAHV